MSSRRQDTGHQDATSTRLITLDLIRKRSEHNECLVSTLEEIALHQEELEAIGPILGRTCGKTLRILLLQNNVISRMDPSDLRFMKGLEYLNLALNNISEIEGVEHCEFLNKLDLTLNFIDVDALEKSVDTLQHLRSLRELYLIGNPCACNEARNENGNGPNEEKGTKPRSTNSRGWTGFRMYVVARLPQLEVLDGKDIARSERIVATQKLPELTEELRILAERCKAKKEEKLQLKLADEMQPSTGSSVSDENELTEHTPEVRAEISRDMAQQRAEKEEMERANQPRRRGEKEFEEDQKTAIEKARKREERGDVRQCNEGKWKFHFDEEKRAGYVLLDVAVQKYLSSSLIDVDVHPSYISVVIKSKVLRLVLPAEVKAEESTAQRSTTTGHLLVSMPKVDPEENMLCIRAASRAKEESSASSPKKENQSNGMARKKGLAADMLQEAGVSLTGTVRIEGLVKGGVKQEPPQCDLGMKEVSSQSRRPQEKPHEVTSPGERGVSCKCEDEDDDGPPPLL